MGEAAAGLIFGVDVSGWQHPDTAAYPKGAPIDWARVDGSGCRFGWVKVCEGTGYVNPWWPADKAAMAARAKLTGFVPGAYLFLRQGNGAAQADYFARQAGNLDGWGIAIDCEPTTGSRPTETDLRDCAARLRQLYPGHPIAGYIPGWYWGSQPTTMCQVLWQSRYVYGTAAPALLYAKVPASWWDGYGGQLTDLLQFTSTALVPGIVTPADCSAFRGSRDDYAALVLPPPAPTPAPVPDWQVKMMATLPPLSYAPNVRSAHVERAQAELNVLLRHARKPEILEDGFFGNGTLAAVKWMQDVHGWQQSGVIGRVEHCLLKTGAA
jgi:GH25 family lysozyme M1 (1,4-beta-N-acetylmuramidase)